MAEVSKTKVEPRDPEKNKGTGTRVARRLRKKGLIPGVIYGHKQAVVPVSLTRDDVWRMIKTPGHLADLDVNGTAETVLIRDIQWDHLGKEVLHLDFARVSAEEMIDTEVSFEVRGIPAGLAAGGILEHLIHSVKITCKAGAIPESIKADVSQLQVGEGIHVRDLVLPPDVTVNHDGDLLLAHVAIRAVQEEEKPETAEAEAAVAGPEVIKPERKEKEKE
jgi:large subunit ribosomal protein L25